MYRDTTCGRPGCRQLASSSLKPNYSDLARTRGRSRPVKQGSETTLVASDVSGQEKRFSKMNLNLKMPTELNMKLKTNTQAGMRSVSNGIRSTRSKAEAGCKVM